MRLRSVLLGLALALQCTRRCAASAVDWVPVANLTAPVSSEAQLLDVDSIDAIVAGLTIQLRFGDVAETTVVTFATSVSYGPGSAMALVVGVHPKLVNSFPRGTTISLDSSESTTWTTTTASTTTVSTVTTSVSTTSSWIGFALLPAPAEAGALIIHVDSFQGFQIDDLVQISNGSHSEIKRIRNEVSIGALGSVLGIDQPLQYRYQQGSKVSPANPTPPPTPVPPTPAPAALDSIASNEKLLLDALFAGNATSQQVSVGGVTTTVFKIEIPEPSDSSNGTRQEVMVGAVSFPLSMFAGLGGEELVAAVSTLDDEALANVPTQTSDGSTTELKSVMNINLLAGANGTKVEVGGLVEPIIFPMANSSGSGADLQCQFLDELTGIWRSDGVSVWGYDADGNVLCATLHLSFFGAMLSGFLSTLKCSQASLLAEDSYVELITTDWYNSIGAYLLFALLAFLGAMMVASCVLDCQLAKSGYWRDEYFLVPNSPEPTDDEEEDEGDCAGGCVDGLWSGLEDLIDEFLGSLCEFLGDARSMCAEFFNSVDCTGKKGQMTTQLTMGFMQQSVTRSVAAHYFISMDDMDLLLSDEMNELMDEDGGEPMGADGEPSGDASASRSNDTGGSTGSSDEAVVTIDELAKEPLADAAEKTGEAEARPVETRISVGEAASGQEAGPSTEREGGEETAEGSQEGGEPELKQSTIYSMRNTSDAAAARYEALKKFRVELVQYKKRHTEAHHSWCRMVWNSLQSWMIHGPIGSVFTRSISIPHSTRALFLCIDLLGAAMLTTVFTSATGGSLSKRADKDCSASCQQQGLSDAECIANKLGSLIAVGLASALLAGVPLAILSSLHDRSFVRVAYEGSPNYHRQLRRWRRKDIILWTVGSAYCAFSAHFVMLFFANVAPKDQVNWMISAAIGFFEDFVLVPLGVSVVIFFMAILLITFLSCSHHLKPAHIVKHGDLEHINEVLKTAAGKEEVRDAFLSSQGLKVFMQRRATITLGDSSEGGSPEGSSSAGQSPAKAKRKSPGTSPLPHSGRKDNKDSRFTV